MRWKDVWKSVTTTSGVQYAIMVGTSMMPGWLVGKLDMPVVDPVSLFIDSTTIDWEIFTVKNVSLTTSVNEN